MDIVNWMNAASKPGCSARHIKVDIDVNNENPDNYAHDTCECSACLVYRACARSYKFESADESAFAYRSFAFDRVLYRHDMYGVQVTPSAICLPYKYRYRDVIAIDVVAAVQDTTWPPPHKWWSRALLKAGIIAPANLLITLKDGRGARRIRAQNTAGFKRAVEKARNIVY